MDHQPTASLVKHFEGLADPRSGNAKAHIFLEILILAILAVICGADGWSDVELFGKTKHAWLKIFLKNFRNALWSGRRRLNSSQQDK